MGKKLLFGIGAICILFLVSCQSVQETGPQQGLGRVLILYYSWSEDANTANAAGILQGLTNATVVRVEPAEPFPVLDTADMIAWFIAQQPGFAPEIQGLGVNLALYDFVLIGTPVWGGDVAPPIRTLLLNTDFQGKPVALFAMANTNEGPVLDNFEQQVRNGQVREGIAFRMATEAEVQTRITQWANNL